MPATARSTARAVGSYSASDLSSTNLGAISLYGSNDQVLNRAKLEDNADLLPKGAETVEIEGGNHAASALRPAKRRWRSQHHPAEQQSQTADAIDRYIRPATPSCPWQPQHNANHGSAEPPLARFPLRARQTRHAHDEAHDDDGRLHFEA